MDVGSSIAKLFEEDEDEIHSEADVEAFQAALRRDIEGNASTSQPFLSNTVLPQGINQTGAQVGRAINLHSLRALHSAYQPQQNFPSMEQGPCRSIPQGLGKQQQQYLASYCASDFNTSGSSSKSEPLALQTWQLTHHQSMGSTLPGVSTQALNMTSVENFERQDFIDDPSRLQGGALNYTSTNPVHRQVSTRKELYSSPLSPVTYIKKKSKGKSVYHAAQLQYESHLSAAQGPPIAQVVQGNVIPSTSKDKPLDKQLIDSGFTTTNNMMPMNSVSPFSSSQLDRNAMYPSITSPAGVNARTPQRKPSVVHARTPQRKPSVVHARTPQRKPSVGQKKQLEALDSSPPLPSKKQKVSKAFSEQSIKQLDDVTAFPGFNLQEEVEQLLSGRKDSQVSEADRRVVQEEERGILLKTPLRKKLDEIVAKCGLKYISNDVERCLPMSVEERMRGLIRNLIRLSKQRADAEKPMHPKLITSDVRQKIIELNWKAQEEREEKKAEVEKLQKLDEMKKEGEAAAANVAARAAVGVDDIFSKWQHMAEVARQKRERGIDAASSSQATSGAIRKFGRNQELQTRVARTISVKDVIAVLETEPQMRRSRLIYLLYERIRPMAA